MNKRISLIQMDVAFANPEENYNKVEKMIVDAVKDNPDVICLPETWNVGFFPKGNLSKLADRDGVKTKELLSRLSKKYSVNIVGGSVANKRGDKVYNTAFVFDRGGRCIAEYDKIHGFSPSEEHVYFQGGTKLCTFEVDGIKAGVIICYDMRFLELVRSLALKGIEILFVPAEWPYPRVHHWRTLAMARAIENQMFVAAVNAVGTAGELRICGNSMVIDPWGEVLASAGDVEEVITTDMNFSITKHIRNSINVFRDRRPELYEL
jgi:omega-amidase